MKISYSVLVADHRTNLKESENKDKYLDLVRELKMLWKMKVTIVPIVIGAKKSGILFNDPLTLRRSMNSLRSPTVVIQQEWNYLRIIHESCYALQQIKQTKPKLMVVVGGQYLNEV